MSLPPRNATRLGAVGASSSSVGRVTRGQCSPDWCGKCGYGVWVPGCGAEHPKAEQHPHESTWLQAVHSILRYQVWDCSLWGEQGLPMPGASFHSCRGSNTIAASPVSSLPLLLLVFLSAERWECTQLESWQPVPLSFLLSLSHPPIPLLQHPARVSRAGGLILLMKVTG